MRYLISYDLNTPGKNYQPLWDALTSISAKRTLLSEWCTTRRSNTSAAKLRDWLGTFMDANDRLMVVCLDSNDWAGVNLMTDPNTI